MTDCWPLLPYVKCDNCGRCYPSVLTAFYARTDNERGREYISYRPMRWPFYLPAAYRSRASWWPPDVDRSP